MDLPGRHLLHAHHDGAHVAAALEGGHLVSWRPASGGEALYLRPLAADYPGRPIRGGVPVIFPQFADLGPLSKHGFARTAMWRRAVPGTGEALALEVTDTDGTRAVWPHPFRLTLGIALGGDRLRLALRVQNTGDAPFLFTAALHTYLRVADAERVSVEGLSGVGYRDKTAGDRPAVRSGPLRVSGEMDSVYDEAPDRVVVRDEAGGRLFDVEKSGFADVVVWNPWAEGAAGMADLPDDGYRQMLCVEAAQVARPVRLAPGDRWEGAQTLTLRTL